jgi:AcrR family transcriptional regulator
MEDTSVKNRIMDVSMKLFAENGFRGTTTRQIAAGAQVNEVTIFRNFGSKEGILREIFACRLTNIGEKVEQLSSSMRFELLPDMLAISQIYHEQLCANIDFVLIILREFRNGEIYDLYWTLPQNFTHKITAYLEEMKRRGKIKSENTELAAITFVSMNFGFFIMKNTFGNKMTSITSDEFIQTSVRRFLEGML